MGKRTFSRTFLLDGSEDIGMNMQQFAAFYCKKQEIASLLQMQSTGQTLMLICSSQARHNREAGVVPDKDDGLWKKKNKTWNPNGDLELKLKIILCSHCGTTG